MKGSETRQESTEQESKIIEFLFKQPNKKKTKKESKIAPARRTIKAHACLQKENELDKAKKINNMKPKIVENNRRKRKERKKNLNKPSKNNKPSYLGFCNERMCN
jgi:hypothetical protein